MTAKTTTKKAKQPAAPSADAVAGMPRRKAPPTQPADPDTTNPESADAAKLSFATLASRPHMQIDVYLWALPPLSAPPHQIAVLKLIREGIEKSLPGIRAHIYSSASPIAPQFYVEVNGIISPPERALWRRHVENVVQASIDSAMADPLGAASHDSEMLLFELLAPTQEYDSNAEQRLARLIAEEPSVEKWVKPKRGLFQIEYRSGGRYEPDFVVETKNCSLILEVAAYNRLDDPDVQAKAAAATEWCTKANDASAGKPWTYALVPGDQITGAVTLDDLIARFS
jgi:hypothetical protein